MSTPATRSPALVRLAAWQPDVAVVVGSGLGGLAAHTMVAETLTYAELGWPATAVPGHDNRLLLGTGIGANGREIRLALACGRPHRYEGWSADELARPVTDLAACGVRRLLLTNSCGGLPDTPTGAAVVCDRLVDLQQPPPETSPPEIRLCSPEDAGRAAAVLTGAGGGGTGVYVAVLGPQFETPSEARWLRRHGHVVGMSAAPEVRAAQGADMDCLLLALVVNAAAAVGSHDDVLAAGTIFSAALHTDLIPLICARWPELGP